MDRRAVLRNAVVVGSGLLAGCAGVGGSGTEATYHNPVFEPILADPSVIRASDGTFYAYGTSDNWHDGEGLRRTPMVKSPDLVNWEYAGEALATRPDWKNHGNVWAPDIARYRDQYYYYYSLSVWGDPNPGIGVATAPSPEGPFTDHGKLFTSKEIGVPNSIDPFFYEDDGTPYLFWGSFHGIYGVELTPDGFDYRPETKFRIAGSDFEAAYIVKRDGMYYFFGSVGSCCSGVSSTYRVTVGRSASLKGPYVNSIGDDLQFSPGTVILHEGRTFVGPGHNCVVRSDAGTDWIVYHAYERENPWAGKTPRRPLMLDPLTWTDGWPLVETRTPSEKQTVPVIDG